MDVVRVGEGSQAVELTVENINGRGLWCSILGGDSPHIGAVSAGNPSSGVSSGHVLCDINQICLPGHRDAIAGVMVTEALVKATGLPASVTAGIHMDGATAEDIEQMVANVKEAARLWIEQYAS